MQSCDRINDPYYMSTEELRQCLEVLSQKDFTVNGKPIETIHLTGGDPLTHPRWREFCWLIHDYLPNISIDISTNGLLMNKISDEELLLLGREYKVTFQFSIYPNVNLLKMYKKLLARFKALDLRCTFYGGSHFFFSKQEKIIEKADPKRGYGKQCQQMLLEQNHAIFYKGKIYNCWKDINILQKECCSTDDLYAFNSNTPSELSQNKEHYYCDLCKRDNGSGGKEFILWQHHNKNADKIFNSNLKDLFIYDYPLYYSLQHNCDYIEVLNDELFQKFLSNEQRKYAETRYLKGKGDILIPFSQEISDSVKIYLSNLPEINQYNIYLISVQANSKIEEKVYKTFLPFNEEENLNNYFLKANNILSAYNTFIKNSYLSNKFILDITDPNLKLISFN